MSSLNVSNKKVFLEFYWQGPTSYANNRTKIGRIEAAFAGTLAEVGASLSHPQGDHAERILSLDVDVGADDNRNIITLAVTANQLAGMTLTAAFFEIYIDRSVLTGYADGRITYETRCRRIDRPVQLTNIVSSEDLRASAVYKVVMRLENTSLVTARVEVDENVRASPIPEGPIEYLACQVSPYGDMVMSLKRGLGLRSIKEVFKQVKEMLAMLPPHEKAVILSKISSQQ